AGSLRDADADLIAFSVTDTGIAPALRAGAARPEIMEKIVAAHPGLHPLAAAALTAAVLLARWWTTRAVRGPHGASAAKAPWRRAAPPPTGEESVPDRVAELHASFLDPALRETDAHLEQYWNKLTSLYPHRDGKRRHR
ncbi:hypothetical protein, partial [Streptomyces altiplanensis]